MICIRCIQVLIEWCAVAECVEYVVQHCRGIHRSLLYKTRGKKIDSIRIRIYQYEYITTHIC